jgi:hypothetical protein
VEHTPDTGSYWGELLGLMATHLILRGMNEPSPNLTGSVHILSDCLGGLSKVEDLLPYRIPTKCSHSDILKNIMANCSNLSFSQIFSHVKAHQDDGRKYGDLLCEAQLNCQMDYLAKKAIHEAPPTHDAAMQHFPFEPLGVFLGKNKLTSDKGERQKFWVHKQLTLYTGFPGCSKSGRASKLWILPRLMETSHGNDPSAPFAQAVRRSLKHVLMSFSAITPDWLMLC